ncbi:MAG: hypothetical protein MHM6MM_003599 [Cercozoa sp. M6MM]
MSGMQMLQRQLRENATAMRSFCDDINSFSNSAARNKAKKAQSTKSKDFPIRNSAQITLTSQAPKSDSIVDTSGLKDAQAVTPELSQHVRKNEVQQLKEQGNALFGRKMYDEAVSVYTSALNLSTASTDESHDTQLLKTLFSNRAAAHFQRQRLQQAIADCDACLALDCSAVTRLDAKVNLRRGTAFEKLKQHKQAIASFKEAIRLCKVIGDTSSLSQLALKGIQRCENPHDAKTQTTQKKAKKAKAKSAGSRVRQKLRRHFGTEHSEWRAVPLQVLDEADDDFRAIPITVIDSAMASSDRTVDLSDHISETVDHAVDRTSETVAESDEIAAVVTQASGTVAEESEKSGSFAEESEKSGSFAEESEKAVEPMEVRSGFDLMRVFASRSARVLLRLVLAVPSRRLAAWLSSHWFDAAQLGRLVSLLRRRFDNTDGFLCLGPDKSHNNDSFVPTEQAPAKCLGLLWHISRLTHFGMLRLCLDEPVLQEVKAVLDAIEPAVGSDKTRKCRRNWEL